MAKQPAPGRTRANDPERMRGRFLDVASELFQRPGYHATSMHDVMRAAGATGGALYYHFPTKKALALGVVRERVGRAVETTWVQPLRSAPTALDGILTVFNRIAAELDRRDAVTGCPVNNLALELSLVDAEFRTAIQGLFEQWRLAIADRLRVDQAAGHHLPVDPDALATLIVASYSGAMSLAKAQQSSRPLVVCGQQLARFIRPDGAGIPA